MKNVLRKIMDFIRKVFKKNKKGGGKMKFAIVVALLLVSGLVWAQTPITIPTELTAKQGMVETFKGELQNTTTFEMIKTRPIENAPKIVNLLWDGLSIDGGFAWDASSADNAVILVSRHINDWEKYLPITIPDAVKVFDISANIGIEARDFTTHVNWAGCGGFSYLRATVKF